MNIALIADWLPTYGGAEHVVSAFHELWPEAPIFTTVAASPEKLGPLSGADIRPDKFLQRIYGFTGRHQYLLPWMPRAVERINLGDGGGISEGFKDPRTHPDVRPFRAEKNPPLGSFHCQKGGLFHRQFE